MKPAPSPIHHFLLTALALAFACTGDDATPSDGGGSGDATTSTTAASTLGATNTGDPGTADSTGTPPPENACACVAPDPFGEGGGTCHTENLVAWVPGCPQDQPCSRVAVECSRPGADLYDCMAELAFDEAAMQCALETLRDGTPSRLVIDGLMDYGIFSGQSLYLVQVLEGRTAVRLGCLGGDAGADTYGPGLHALADPGYFTGCMAVQSPRERYDCMLEGLGEGTKLPECPG